MPARRSRRARTAKYTSGSPRALRCEQLESRNLLAAISFLGGIQPAAGSKAPPATPPTLAHTAKPQV